LLVILMVVLLWDTHRLATLGVFAALFLVGGIAGTLVLKRRLERRPKMFASSLGELAKDEERLQ
ncbi:MAG: phage holin family protein, partial [Burkholderiales bacterium]